MPALFAFLHHVAAFVLVSAIVVQWLLMRDSPTPTSIGRLARADAFIGVAAVSIVVIGVLRVLYFEKGVAFYMHSPAFFAKMALFVAVALLSIGPTVRFIGWQRALKAGNAERNAIAPSATQVAMVRRLLHLELIGIVLILLCAALMARGVGNF